MSNEPTRELIENRLRQAAPRLDADFRDRLVYQSGVSAGRANRRPAYGWLAGITLLLAVSAGLNVALLTVDAGSNGGLVARDNTTRGHGVFDLAPNGRTENAVIDDSTLRTGDSRRLDWLDDVAAHPVRVPRSDSELRPRTPLTPRSLYVVPDAG